MPAPRPRPGATPVRTRAPPRDSPASRPPDRRFPARRHRPRPFLTPVDRGGLGFAFPVALGAKLGRPEAPVVAIHGDGGYPMNSQEIATAVRHRNGAVE